VACQEDEVGARRSWTSEEEEGIRVVHSPYHVMESVIGGPF
jgi:hypothetical protein